MKIIGLLLGSLLSVSVLACPNLSGTYESYNEDGLPERFTVTQKGCEEVGYFFNQDFVNLIADNKERLVLTKREITEMGEVSAKLFAKGYFTSDKLFVNQKAEVTFFGQTQTQTSSMIISLTSNGDIMSVTTDPNGTRTETAKRIK